MKTNFNNIKEIFNEFSPFAPTNCGIYEIKIKIETINVDGNAVRICLSIGELYDDWNGECGFCPENDALIEYLELSYNDKTIVVEKELLNNLTFEKMIEIVEDIWL